jgi:Fe-S-cluster-containing dehydrogenase component/DMSO reductase anchor subunit
MTRPCFTFDLNKCVGCQACIVGCAIENSGRFDQPLRKVFISNNLHHGGIARIFLSLACNHCMEPLCEQNCPARAYTIDKSLGTVVHHAERCIGCKYCTWVCPYDAPVFNPGKGTIEKCTFCNHMISEGHPPACAEACPTGALGFALLHPPVNLVSGFPETGINPSIQLISLRDHTPLALPGSPGYAENEPGAKPPGGQGPAIFSAHHDTDADRVISFHRKKSASWPQALEKLQKEWSLVMFTLFTGLLVAWLFAVWLGFTEKHPAWFTLMAAGLMALAAAHAGKKQRLWRFILNVRRSWLSREILMLGIFFSGGTAWLLVPEMTFAGIIALVTGTMGIYCIDQVYRPSRSDKLQSFHSASVLPTFILLFFLFTGIVPVILTLLFIKLILYSRQKILLAGKGKPYRPVLSVLRAMAGIFIPAILVATSGETGSTTFLLIMVGELTDRAEFYIDMKFISPGDWEDK